MKPTAPLAKPVSARILAAKTQRFQRLRKATLKNGGVMIGDEVEIVIDSN
jgi:hypothetical protein